MNIILVGCGKVGEALTYKLLEEGHDVTVIDINSEKIHQITEELDVLGIVGNGSSIEVLEEANFEIADVFIAVTGSDELNLLCCMFAKKAGRCRCVARVRNPLYSKELDFIRDQLGISTIINPEMATAREISRVLRFPAADKIDVFADGKVRLIKFQLSEPCGFDTVPLKDMHKTFGTDVLICAVERGSQVIVPDGGFVLARGDIVTLLATKEKAIDFFKKLHLPVEPVKNVMIVGGGTVAYYLAKDLLAHDIRVRLIEKDIKKCEQLTEMLPGAMILHGDGTNRQFLLNEGIGITESFVALTDMDEENVLLSLFAKKQGVPVSSAKVNRMDFSDIIEELNIGNVIYPKFLICDFIVQHIRALQNEMGSNIKNLYRILDDRVEVVEFTVHNASRATDVPLSELRLKPNQLICYIARGDEVIIPRGNNRIKVGDSVIVVSLIEGLKDLCDILED